MAVTVYDIGKQVTVSATFRAAATPPAVGALTDPTTVVAKVRKPDGTVTALTVAHPSLGVFTATVTIDQSGAWTFRFEGTGALVSSVEQTVTVRTSAFYPTGV